MTRAAYKPKAPPKLRMALPLKRIPAPNCVGCGHFEFDKSGGSRPARNKYTGETGIRQTVKCESCGLKQVFFWFRPYAGKPMEQRG